MMYLDGLFVGSNSALSGCRCTRIWGVGGRGWPGKDMMASVVMTDGTNTISSRRGFGDVNRSKWRPTHRRSVQTLYPLRQGYAASRVIHGVLGPNPSPYCYIPVADISDKKRAALPHLKWLCMRKVRSRSVNGSLPADHHHPELGDVEKGIKVPTASPLAALLKQGKRQVGTCHYVRTCVAGKTRLHWDRLRDPCLRLAIICGLVVTELQTKLYVWVLKYHGFYMQFKHPSLSHNDLSSKSLSCDKPPTLSVQPVMCALLRWCNYYNRVLLIWAFAVMARLLGRSTPNLDWISSHHWASTRACSRGEYCW